MIRTLPSFRRKGSFSIVELLVAMAVLSFLVVLIASITVSSFKLWRTTVGSIKMFSAARTAFGIMATRVGQATLNPYLDYYDSSWNRRGTALTNVVTFSPTYYGRASDLHFYSGPAAIALSTNALYLPGDGIFFFAPLGYSNNNPNYADVPTLLNPVSYYVEWGSDSSYRPGYPNSFLANLPQKYRYRLIENILPTQNFTTAVGGYPAFTTSTNTYANYMQWINNGLKNNTVSSGKSILADNVIALIVRPELSSQQEATNAFNSPSANTWNLTSNYIYDSQALSVANAGRPTISTNNPSALWFAQLPPLLRVVIVAVDEASARRLTTGTTPPPAFQISSSLFQTPGSLSNDLYVVSNQLNTNHVSYQIFNQLIPIRGAEFSTQQE